MEQYLQETGLLNYSHPRFDALFDARGWDSLPKEEKIRKIYDFVRDEIRFGYNLRDDLPASVILGDGYGQCNTKGILLMTLLRKAGIPCRFHGFTIDKKLQKGAITGLWYRLSPDSIVHSWVEVFHGDMWYELEGFIIDRDYLGNIQKAFPGKGAFCGYGIATKALMNPEIEWEISNTYIQKEGINGDFGVFDDPDTFFLDYKQNLGFLKRMVYESVVRRIMNKNVGRIRKRGIKELN